MSKKAAPTAESKVSCTGQSASAPINANLSKEEKIELHRKMVRIRRFEERSCEVPME